MEGGDCWWSLVAGSDRWGGAVISGRGERSQLDGSNRRWRGGVSGGGELLLVEGSNLRWRGARGQSSHEGDQLLVKGSGLRCRALWREQSQVEGSYCRLMRAVSGGEEQSLVEGAVSGGGG